MKSTGYNYDIISNTLTITAVFAKKASQIGTQEYSTMMILRRDNPGLIVKKAECANRTPVANAVKFADMEYYISLFPLEKRDTLMKMYKTMRVLSKTHASPYQFVRDWFLDYFPYFNADPTFDENGNQTNLLTKTDMELKAQEEEFSAMVDKVKDGLEEAA